MEYYDEYSKGYVKVPADADNLMDQALLDIGVKFVKLAKEGYATPCYGGNVGPGAGCERVEMRQEDEGLDPALLKRCVKQTGIVLLCEIILALWHYRGLLSDVAAVPAFIVLAALAGLSLGRLLKRG